MIARMKKNTLNYSISNAIFIMVACSLFVIITVFCWWVTLRQWKTIKYTADTEFSKTIGYINAELDTYIENSIMLATNADFVRILRTTYPESSQARTDATVKLSNFFNIVPVRTEIDKPAYMVYSDNSTMYKSKYFQRLSDIPDFDVTKALDANDYLQILWTVENENSFVFYREIDSGEVYRNILRVEVYPDKINSYVENCSDENFYASFEQSKDGNVYDKSAILRNNKPLYLCIPHSVRDNLITRNILISVVAFCVLCAVFLFIINLFTKRMTKDIYNFIESINTDELFLDFNVSDTHKYVEFEVIKNKIIELVLSLRKLHEQIEETEKEKQHAELELAQSKFNPHLLYNTLSVIKWNLMRGTTEKLASVIDILTNYYRAVLKHDTIIALNEELSLIEQYIHIMEITHAEEYKVVFSIEEKLKGTKVIRHTLQPLVENAILHGLNQRGGTIIISAYCKDDGFVISVKDNGYGMSREKINEICSDNYESVYSSYGIKNTKNRLSVFFGKENFDFKIESKENEFTEIKLIIKKMS